LFRTHYAARLRLPLDVFRREALAMERTFPVLAMERTFPVDDVRRFEERRPWLERLLPEVAVVLEEVPRFRVEVERELRPEVAVLLP